MESKQVQIDFNKDWWVRDDLQTLSGRLLHYVKVTDMRKCFVSADTLNQYVKDLQEAKSKAVNGIG